MPSAMYVMMLLGLPKALIIMALSRMPGEHLVEMKLLELLTSLFNFGSCLKVMTYDYV